MADRYSNSNSRSMLDFQRWVKTKEAEIYGNDQDGAFKSSQKQGGQGRIVVEGPGGQRYYQPIDDDNKTDPLFFYKAFPSDKDNLLETLSENPYVDYNNNLNNNSCELPKYYIDESERIPEQSYHNVKRYYPEDTRRVYVGPAEFRSAPPSTLKENDYLGGLVNLFRDESTGEVGVRFNGGQYSLYDTGEMPLGHNGIVDAKVRGRMGSLDLDSELSFGPSGMQGNLGLEAMLLDAEGRLDISSPIPGTNCEVSGYGEGGIGAGLGIKGKISVGSNPRKKGSGQGAYIKPSFGLSIGGGAGIDVSCDGKSIFDLNLAKKERKYNIFK